MSTDRPQPDEVYGHPESALAPVWQDTVILVITEFGRTVEVNGSLGPKLVSVATASPPPASAPAAPRGRPPADRLARPPPSRPLRGQDTQEGSDLAPTADLRSVIKGLALELFDANPRALTESVFPDSNDARPLLGLIA